MTGSRQNKKGAYRVLPFIKNTWKYKRVHGDRKQIRDCLSGGKSGGWEGWIPKEQKETFGDDGYVYCSLS